MAETDIHRQYDSGKNGSSFDENVRGACGDRSQRQKALWEFVRSKAPSATNHLAVHAELTQFLFRLLFGQEVDAVDTLFFGRLHIHQRIIQENALICL